MQASSIFDLVHKNVLFTDYMGRYINIIIIIIVVVVVVRKSVAWFQSECDEERINHNILYWYRTQWRLYAELCDPAHYGWTVQVNPRVSAVYSSQLLLMLLLLLYLLLLLLFFSRSLSFKGGIC